MSTDRREPQEDLAEQSQIKEDEVLEREGFEQELMDDDASEVGRDVDGVQEGNTP